MVTEIRFLHKNPAEVAVFPASALRGSWDLVSKVIRPVVAVISNDKLGIAPPH